MKNACHAVALILIWALPFGVLHASQVDEKAAREKIIARWASGHREEALQIASGWLRPPEFLPATGRGNVAAIRNLVARIHYEHFQELRASDRKGAGDELRTAEISSAAAVWENPYDLAYWRDYIKIAAEQRTPPGAQTTPEALKQLQADLLRRHILYPELRRRFELTEADELRHVGHAIVRSAQGDVFDAQRILESWIAEPKGRTRCVAAVILMELQLETDQFVAASEHAHTFAPLCDGIGQDVFKRRLKSLSLREVSHTNQSIKDTSTGSLQFNDEMEVTERDPFDTADRILRDPTRYADWVELHETAGTDKELLDLFDALTTHISKRYGHKPPFAVTRARAFRLLEEGRFEKARVELDKLIAADPDCDGEILVAAVLIDTDIDLVRSSESRHRLLQARSTAPQLAACVNIQAIDPCLSRRNECVLGAVLCKDADSDRVYRLWHRGWTSRRSGPDQVDRKVDSLRTRVELNEKLIGEIPAKIDQMDRSLEQRIATLNSRIDLIQEIILPEITAEVRRVELDSQKRDREIRRRVTALGDDLRRSCQAEAANLERLEAIGRDAQITAADAARVASALAINLETLKALRPQLPKILDPNVEGLKVQVAQLTETVRKLEVPGLMKDIETLQDLRKASWAEIVDSTAHLVDDIAEIATKPGSTTLKIAKLVKHSSDVVLDWYQKKTKDAMPR